MDVKYIYRKQILTLGKRVLTSEYLLYGAQPPVQGPEIMYTHKQKTQITSVFKQCASIVTNLLQTSPSETQYTVWLIHCYMGSNVNVSFNIK